MNGYLKSAFVACLSGVVLAPIPVAAQDNGRFRVLIPYFEPLAGADDDFGEDASDELRDLMSTLLTHDAMSEDDIEDEARRFDVDMDELDCTLAIQMATQLAVPVTICATYAQTPDRSWVVNATIRSVADGEDFVVDEFTVGRNDGEELAAQRIFSEFDRFNNQVRATMFCGQYAASQQWTEALRQCDVALALNPDATSTRYLRAQLLRELERNDESLQESLQVLDEDPFHEGALQLAGYFSAVSGRDQAAREYYGRYLDINPGDVTIRMRVAYDLARAGDPVGALDLVAAGLEVDPENADLWDQYGGFAFRAGQDAQAEHRLQNPDSDEVAPEAAQHYREAIRAYGRVFEVRGAAMPADRLRNVLRAHLQLGEHQLAVDDADRFLEAHPEDAQLWSLRADALYRLGRAQDALASLDTVLEIDPAYPSARLRRASWLLQARLVDDAIATLAELAEISTDQADEAARMAWTESYRNGYETQDFAHAIRVITAAKGFENLSEEMVHQLNFWHGHNLMRATIPEQEALTPTTAQAALPKFQEALRLVRASGDYATTVGMDLEREVVQPILTYIDIQEAVIQRGRP